MLQSRVATGGSANCGRWRARRCQQPCSSRVRKVCTRAAATSDVSPPGNRVVVIGGGWAGFGAAKHLSEQGYEVTLLEAGPNPGGLSGGFRSQDGKAVEAGMKGFWYQYHNIFSLLRDLGGDWPLTDWTTSGFWSPRGLVTEAPVFSKQTQLPTLVGQFVHTYPLYWDLPLQERLTMLPFLLSFLDVGSGADTYEQYDKMSAHELFRQWGVSRRCYEEFLKPTLLVGLFAPPEDISAAAMLQALWFYALAHQNDFDVCWPRGPIAELIFTPMVDRIRAAGGQVIGSKLVVGFDSAGGPGSEVITAVQTRDTATGTVSSYPADAVVFAIGVTGMQKLVQASPLLASRQEFRNVMALRGLDVIATRLWFDRRVETRYPANVLSGFEPSAGATWFDLNRLQDEYRDAPGSVITADVYNSSLLMPLSDEAVVERMAAHIATCEPGFRGARVVDSAVLRYPKAVTHFSPGSMEFRPTQTCSLSNVVLAGDWVKGVKHGANGLSQERAYVTGLLAANIIVGRLGRGSPAVILDVEQDEPHIALGKQAARSAREALKTLGVGGAWM